MSRNEGRTSICPWCDTEMIWDPEIGPEDTCPHCQLELTDYREVTIRADDPDERIDDDAYDEGEPDDEMDDETDDDDLGWEGPADGEIGEPDDLIVYEEGVERQLDSQEELPECAVCQEPMVYAGEEAAGGGFRPAAMVGTGEPVLSGAFRLKLYVCPSCFRIERFLGEEERNGWMQRFSRDPL